MQNWIYSELILQTPGIDAQAITLGFAKGVLQFTIFGDATGTKNYQPQQVGDIIAHLGQQGWELVSMTESLQPNTWLRTRWIFKKPMQIPQGQ
jgi:hypothetical protein